MPDSEPKITYRDKYDKILPAKPLQYVKAFWENPEYALKALLLQRIRDQGSGGAVWQAMQDQAKGVRLEVPRQTFNGWVAWARGGRHWGRGPTLANGVKLFKALLDL